MSVFALAKKILVGCKKIGDFRFRLVCKIFGFGFSGFLKHVYQRHFPLIFPLIRIRKFQRIRIRRFQAGHINCADKHVFFLKSESGSFPLIRIRKFQKIRIRKFQAGHINCADKHVFFKNPENPNPEVSH